MTSEPRNDGDDDASADADLRSSQRACICIGALLLVIAVIVASNHPWPAHTRDENARFGTSLTSMDYEPTDTFVRPVYVDGGGGDSAGTGGSTVLGAFSLPVRWHPGLTVRVKWRRCARGGPYIPDEIRVERCRWMEKDVPVHPYTDVGSTIVHLFADDQVLVIPGMHGPRHEDYPGAPPPYKNFYEKMGIGHDE